MLETSLKLLEYKLILCLRSLLIIELRLFALTESANGTSVLLKTTSKIAAANFTGSFVAFDDLDSSRHVDVLTQTAPIGGDDIPWIFKYVEGDVAVHSQTILTPVCVFIKFNCQYYLDFINCIMDYELWI